MAPRVIGVRFREASKIYHFAPPDYPLHASDYVVVDTPMGFGQRGGGLWRCQCLLGGFR